MAENNFFPNLEEAIAGKGRFVRTASGNSMYPMLRSVKDPVLIVPPDGHQKRYDVVLYRSTDSADRYIIHRILEVFPDHYVIRGDNCLRKEYVETDRVIGVMRGFWKGKMFIPSDNGLYMLYARVWVALNPLVRLEHRVRSRVSWLFHRAFPDAHPLHRKK